MVCTIAEHHRVLAAMLGFCCERTITYLHDVFDDILSASRPIDDMSLSYANVISELAMVISDGVLAFTDSHFSTADARPFTEFLCTV